MTHKVLIDTDPGIDDAMAVFYAALHPGIDLVGMTTVFGNVTTEIATRNAIVLAERAGQEIPVAKGADVPLVQPPNPVTDFVHGVEGFGTMLPQAITGKPLDEPAHEFICRMIHENPHEIILCPVGPLTNIALALRHDPSIVSKVKDIVIMGGALDMGNVTEYAEANIWNDPHAADEVFAADWSVTVAGLNVTTKVVCHPFDFEHLAQASPVMGGFLNEAAQFYMDFYATLHEGKRCCHMHDPSALIAITNPDYFSAERHALEVVVEGVRVGQTVRSVGRGRTPQKVLMGVDSVAVKKQFMSVIEEGF